MTRNERLQRQFERQLCNNDRAFLDKKWGKAMYEYEKAFQPIPEKGASRHLIASEDINLLIAVDTLVEAGTLVGQGEMLTQDTIYYLNPEKENPALRLKWENGQDRYTSPQERLQRPTQLRNGVTQCITVRNGELEAIQLSYVRAELKKLI